MDSMTRRFACPSIPASFFFTSASAPSPLFADRHTTSSPCGRMPKYASHLLYTRMHGVLSAPSWRIRSSTTRACSSHSGLEMSITCSSTSAYFSSSSVALNASIRCVGSFLIKPTVSLSSTSCVSSSRRRRVVVSSVSKSLSFAGMLSPVRQLSSVDFPAFV